MNANTINRMITRRASKGFNRDESEAMLEDILAANMSRTALISALVYEEFATERQAERIADSVRTVGYICKRCGDVAPTGIGYASTEQAAVERSHLIDSCACGYSQKSTA